MRMQWVCVHMGRGLFGGGEMTLSSIRYVLMAFLWMIALVLVTLSILRRIVPLECRH